MHQIRFPQGLCPRPCWGVYSAPPNSLAVFKRLTSRWRAVVLLWLSVPCWHRSRPLPSSPGLNSGSSQRLAMKNWKTKASARQTWLRTVEGNLWPLNFGLAMVRWHALNRLAWRLLVDAATSSWHAPEREDGGLRKEGKERGRGRDARGDNDLMQIPGYATEQIGITLCTCG